MRGSLIGLLLLAACYQPTVRSGAPCSTDLGCPQGQMCVSGFCSSSPSPVDGAPGTDVPIGVADRDGDGIPEDKDNCPDKTNSDQADEDNDRRGDACDSCPAVADTGAPDSDGDGLADACDPTPTGPTHETKWLFEGFHGGMPTWPSSPNWYASGNSDTVSVAVSGNTDEYTDLPLSSPGRSFGNFTITVAFTVSQAAGSTGPGPEFGVAFWDGSADKVVDCSLFQNGSNTSDRHLGMYEATSTSQTADRSKSFGWQTGVQYTLTAARQNTTFTCAVAGPSGPLSATITSQVAPNGASVELFATPGTTALVDWIFVVGP